MLSGAVRKPIADITPAPRGQMTRGQRRIDATPKACTGPAPPVAKIGKAAMFLPRSIV